MIVDDDEDEDDGDDDDDGMGWDGRTAACVVRNEQSSMYAWSPSELIRYGMGWMSCQATWTIAWSWICWTICSLWWR